MGCNAEYVPTLHTKADQHFWSSDVKTVLQAIWADLPQGLMQQYYRSEKGHRSAQK